MGDTSSGVIIDDTSQYEAILKTDGQYGSDVEMASLIDLYPTYTFRIHVYNDGSIVTYGSISIVYDLLFFGEIGNGHYDILTMPNTNVSIPFQKKHNRKASHSITGRRKSSRKKITYYKKMKSVASISTSNQVQSKTNIIQTRKGSKSTSKLEKNNTERKELNSKQSNLKRYIDTKSNSLNKKQAIPLNFEICFN
ncbi:hypothetical protein PGB90_005186 [Kerria lacca]